MSKSLSIKNRDKRQWVLCQVTQYNVFPFIVTRNVIKFVFSSRPRDSNKFQIQVNVAATEKVTFELTYRELLRRRNGNYEQTIFINPRQIVEDFRVNVSIEEYRSITNINVPPLRNDILTENMEGMCCT